jgi:hypothetical protein
MQRWTMAGRSTSVLRRISFCRSDNHPLQHTAPPSSAEQFMMGAVNMRGEAEIAHLLSSEEVLRAMTTQTQNHHNNNMVKTEAAAAKSAAQPPTSPPPGTHLTC